MSCLMYISLPSHEYSTCIEGLSFFITVLKVCLCNSESLCSLAIESFQGWSIKLHWHQDEADDRTINANTSLGTWVNSTHLA